MVTRRRGGESARVLIAVLVLFVLLGAGLWWYRQDSTVAAAPPDSSWSDAEPSDTSLPDAAPPVATGPSMSTGWPGGRPRVDLPATAAAGLALVEVRASDSSTGYSRLLFGPDWLDPDGNGCDARNDVLRRDLVEVEIRPRTNGCIVERGVLRDPYSGVLQRFERGPTTSDAVQIDHVVSLANAWRSGAQSWTAPQRAAFANDPLELLAVRKQSNADKDSADAAAWLPPQPSLRCAFVARQVAVKVAYRLRMTQRERDAIAAVLTSCPSQPLPR
jgi:hypothetical protein